MATDAINSANAGLRVTRQRIDIISRNITNAQTEGYSRKIGEQTTDLLGQVQSTPIRRNVNDALVASIDAGTGEQNRLSVLVEMLGKVESQFGTPSQNGSLSYAITDLQNQFQALATSPDKDTFYDNAIASADNLTRTFNKLSQSVADVTAEAQQRVSDEVESVNQALDDLQKVNVQISALGDEDDKTDLLDQQDRLVKQIKGSVDVTTFVKPNGAVAVFAKNGIPLLDDTARHIQVNGTGPVQQNIPPNPAISLKYTSGTLAGLDDIRLNKMPKLSAQLDDIARALTETFQAIYPAGNELFNDAGATPLNGANALQVKGYAARISVNDTVRTTPTLMRNSASVGDTTTIDLVVAAFKSSTTAFTASTGLPATGNLANVAASVISGQSQARKTAEDQQTQQESVTQVLQNKLSSESGVKLDDELAQLTVLQQAYSANAKIIQTTQKLIDDLLAVIQ